LGVINLINTFFISDQAVSGEVPANRKTNQQINRLSNPHWRKYADSSSPGSTTKLRDQVSKENIAQFNHIQLRLFKLFIDHPKMAHEPFLWVKVIEV
jgi:hypothetical protein